MHIPEYIKNHLITHMKWVNSLLYGNCISIKLFKICVYVCVYTHTHTYKMEILKLYSAFKSLGVLIKLFKM